MRLLLGLGGNLGDVATTFASAAAALAREHGGLAASSLWRTAPIGSPQAEYLNAALLVDVKAPIQAILATCQRLEASAGRDRAREGRWGPRSLDIDLLMVPGLVVESHRLTLPHPRLDTRRFALLPACELVPDWAHPRRHRSLGELLGTLDPAAQPCHLAGPFPYPTGGRCPVSSGPWGEADPA